MTLYLIEQIVIQNTFQLLSNESILKNYTSNLYLLLLYMNNWSKSVDSLLDKIRLTYKQTYTKPSIL